MYRIDKTKFKGQTVEEAANQSEYYKHLSWKERFRIAIYLNSIAFKMVGKDEPRINKKFFKARSRDNG